MRIRFPALVLAWALTAACLAQTCPLPPADCTGALYCGGEWDFEAGFTFTPHMLAGQCAGPGGGGAVSCVPADKLAHVAVGWRHWASFPTWQTPGFWGTVAFNENKNCDNVYRGNRSQELTMTCANGAGVIYKQAAVAPQRRIRVQAMMKFTPNGAFPDVEHALGIDPAGGTDPASPGIQWAIWNQPAAGRFNAAAVEAVSGGSIITVLIRQRAFEPSCEGQTFMIDDVKVFDLGPAGPAIAVEPARLDVTAPVESGALSRPLTIRNTGTSTLSYAVTAGASWLTVSPDAGSAAGETDTLVVSLDTADLLEGVYESALTVSAEGAIGSPAAVPVSLRITRKPGDFDGDRDVDQSDFGIFQQCYTGPSNVQAAPACAGTDFDGDADVDVADFARFQACFSGPGVSSNPHCLTH